MQQAVTEGSYVSLHELTVNDTMFNSNLAGIRQVLQDGDLARVRPNHAIVLVGRGQPEGDQATHHAEGRLLQD